MARNVHRLERSLRRQTVPQEIPVAALLDERMEPKTLGGIANRHLFSLVVELSQPFRRRSHEHQGKVPVLWLSWRSISGADRAVD